MWHSFSRDISSVRCLHHVSHCGLQPVFGCRGERVVGDVVGDVDGDVDGDVVGDVDGDVDGDIRNL